MGAGTLCLHPPMAGNLTPVATNLCPEVGIR
jgi:hypothetical protein